MRQFRYFLSVTTACALLLRLAISSYPFEPQRLLLTFVWVVVGSVVATGLWIFIQMDRNTLMSHISGTSPNELTVNAAFVVRILAWGVVPAQRRRRAVPRVRQFLFTLVSPFAGALH